MKKTLVGIGVVASMLVPAGSALADRSRPDRDAFRSFEPLAASAQGDGSDWDPAAPWILPAGYSQTVVKDETDLNIYDGGRDDWHDMNTVNETGRQRGRYMYTTHEVRGVPEGGAVSVHDLWTGETRVIAQDTSWNALDGIRWTPWGTVLFAEEVEGGRLFELVLDRNDPMSGTVYERPAVGLMAHEGIEVGSDGSVYVVDEHRGQTQGCAALGTPCGGGIYRFVPDRRGDMSSGKLFALSASGPDGTGQYQWVGPIDPANVRESGTLAGGTSYQRPEDLEIIGRTLYAAITEGDGYRGRVIAIDLRRMTVKDFVKPGVNVTAETADTDGFASPDNLASTPDGRLVIVEDNVPSDIWFTEPDRNHDGLADSVELFASLTDDGAEGTGIYFGTDPNVLYVNVQHSKADDGDATWAITRDRGRHDEDRDDHDGHEGHEGHEDDES